MALLVLGLTGAMTANADVFIDDHASSVRSEAIEKVVEKQTKPAVKTVKKQVNTTNKISTINYQQKISTFHHIGKKEVSPKIQGFAQDISMKEALENLVPETWKVEVNEKVDLAQKVNFAGGETWNDTVERIGKDNFSATMNWNDKTLSIVPIDTRYKADTVASTEDIAGKKVGLTDKKVKAKKVVKAKSTTAKKSKVSKTNVGGVTEGTWLLSKNYTLRQNIEMWAKKAGWTVAWKAPDYNVIADARFTGAIDSENGPIISILKHYEDATLPLKVNIMGGNKVINVESRHFMPKDVVDLSLELN